MIKLTLLAIAISFVAGCTVVDEPLMPTPVIYQVQNISPLDHLPENERWNLRRVFYVTTRQRDDSIQRINYNNKIDDKINVGLSAIGFGDANLSWADLNAMSRQYPRDPQIHLSLAGIFEVGSYKIDQNGNVTENRGATAWLVNEINLAIQQSRKKDILIYVHGAKVNFYNANVFAAQLDHFMGRDMTSLAFSWPTRQNIFAYSFGDDLNRAYQAAPALVSVIEQLAEKTKAEHIHILSWSAGGRVVSSALKLLRERNNELTADQMRSQFRLGTVYFAAADVPVDEFVDNLPAINDSVQRVVVTASDEDGALKNSELFMRGASRIGLLNPELNQEQQAIVAKADRLEYVDMSAGSESRGFDITGHRYWFNHPWASTDALLSIRTDLDPEQRGLESSEAPMVWWMADDYPERVKQIQRPIP